MILGIGIDSIDIIRFAPWHTYSRTTLLRVFSPHDLDYCLQKPALSAQRFATRFATREATYKAICTYAPTPPPLLMLCKAVQIEHNQAGAPQLIVDWAQLPGIAPATTLLSITHTATTATVIVLLQAHPERVDPVFAKASSGLR
jgi:phosphopantetheine--protein transferase-like protein